jgi:NAD(P)H-hydrate epimerase
MDILIKTSTTPMLIDADGINSLKGERAMFSKLKAPIILTPHPGEMSRLLGGRVRKRVKAPILELLSKIEQDRINTAVSFAKDTKTFLVLKGVPTIIASPDGKAFLNPTGNAGMATAGTGDVLTGMISGLLGQNKDALHACVLGVYLHGRAGDIAASEKGQHSLIATDIINNIPAAFHSLKEE